MKKSYVVIEAISTDKTADPAKVEVGFATYAELRTAVDGYLHAFFGHPQSWYLELTEEEPHRFVGVVVYSHRVYAVRYHGMERNRSRPVIMEDYANGNLVAIRLYIPSGHQYRLIVESLRKIQPY